jgi:hypothetical protein
MNKDSERKAHGRLGAATGSAIPPMPKVNPRRPYDDAKPDGYLESLNDWYHNNEEAVNWFLENAEAIRAVLPNKQICE